MDDISEFISTLKALNSGCDESGKIFEERIFSSSEDSEKIRKFIHFIADDEKNNNNELAELLDFLISSTDPSIISTIFSDLGLVLRRMLRDGRTVQHGLNIIDKILHVHEENERILGMYTNLLSPDENEEQKLHREIINFLKTNSILESVGCARCVSKKQEKSKMQVFQCITKNLFMRN